MNRIDVIQAAADRVGARTYLEVGIKRGATFLAVRVRRKFAVDPVPLVPRRARLRSILAYPPNLLATVAPTTSDAFFASPPRRLTSRGVDVAFVDGLHTYRQSLRDVENCLALLNPGGVVLLHDCSPPSADAATPAQSPPPGVVGWNGDVWKTIAHLRATARDLHVSVLDCDCGIGVVIPEPGAGPAIDLDPDALDDMGFADLDARRDQLLGLRPPDHLPTLLERLPRR